MTDQFFYLQDSRTYTGNDMVFWKTGGGYTTDVSKAEQFAFVDAQNKHNCRETDIPWPKDYLDGKTRPAVDVQYVKRAEALKDTGIVITESKQPRKNKR